MGVFVAEQRYEAIFVVVEASDDMIVVNAPVTAYVKEPWHGIHALFTTESVHAYRVFAKLGTNVVPAYKYGYVVDDAWGNVIRYHCSEAPKLVVGDIITFRGMVNHEQASEVFTASRRVLSEFDV